ncbi:YbjN domain-containing protein [Actinotalea sp.]|uniref:YbjN domain-containing protein n=1 Tax=Actinotalea sp. TaxID=1872145 RepID=UPI002C7C3CBD|nr:YbjN domain-containing protein [Actinotalea sp.]HQY33474.1 YbjN domain-containing protein [Actinotalea sp.]HRA50935.1 YbjN domain-containing protein [Actinotalea sp.]
MTAGSGEATSRPSGAPRSLTSERIESYLLGCGYHVDRDEDGDLTGTWDGNRFWFLTLGDEHEILQVRGRWQQTLPESQRTAALLVVNDWNRERIWPKTYLRVEDDVVVMYGEVSTDLEHGVTDSQLGQLVSCGLGTSAQLFAALVDLLPGEGPSAPH